MLDSNWTVRVSQHKLIWIIEQQKGALSCFCLPAQLQLEGLKVCVDEHHLFLWVKVQPVFFFWIDWNTYWLFFLSKHPVFEHQRLNIIIRMMEFTCSWVAKPGQFGYSSLMAIHFWQWLLQLQAVGRICLVLPSEGRLVQAECVRTSATGCSMGTGFAWQLFPWRSKATGFYLFQIYPPGSAEKDREPLPSTQNT